MELDIQREIEVVKNNINKLKEEQIEETKLQDIYYLNTVMMYLERASQALVNVLIGEIIKRKIEIPPNPEELFRTIYDYTILEESQGKAIETVMTLVQKSIHDYPFAIEEVTQVIKHDLPVIEEIIHQLKQ